MAWPNEERDTSIRNRAGHVSRIGKSGVNDHLFRVNVIGIPETPHGEQFFPIMSMFAYDHDPRWLSFIQKTPCGSLFIQIFCTIPSFTTLKPLAFRGRGLFKEFGFTTKEKKVKKKKHLRFFHDD